MKIEADNLSSMVYLNAACSSEARYYSADPVVFQAILQYLNKAAPSWMRKARHRYRSKLPNSKLIDEEEDPTVLALQLQKTVHGENNSSISFGESSMLDDAHCAFVEQYNMIQSGIFGPDIVDFTMPLPPNYPRMAGLARFALQDSITNYQKILNSMKKKSLPTTANEVYVPTIVHKLKQAYHKAVKTKENEHRAKLEKSLAHDVRIHLLSERVYYTARRQSYYQLPCMTPHYPNPNYETPAVVPVFNTVARVKEFASDKNFYAKLFGRKITISVTAEPVGRKTVPDDMDVELISIPTTPKAMKPVELSARPAYQKNVKSKKGKSAKGGKTKYIREGSLRSFGRNSSSKFSRSISSKSFRQSIRSSKVSTSKGSTKTSSTSRKVRTKSVKLKRGGFSKSVKGSRKSRSKKLIQVPKGIRRGSIRRKSAQAKRLKKMQDDNNFRGSIKSMRRSSKKGQLA